MPYVDGFLLPVPKKNLKTYTAIAKKAGKVWREHGALDYVECVADDLDATWCQPLDKAVTMKPGDTVVFSYIVYKNRAHRDQVNKKVMADPRMNKIMDMNKMPFDMKRMFYGGFKGIVKA